MPWLELMLLASWVMMLALYPCCCEKQFTCEPCPGGTNNAPQYMTVVISGMADDTCANCDDYDGTYVLEFDEDLSGAAFNQCIWINNAIPLHCGCRGTNGHSIYIISTYDGDVTWGFYVYLEIGCTSAIGGPCERYNRYLWSDNLSVATYTDCNGLEDVSVSYTSTFHHGGTAGDYPCADNQCDASSATCSVSSGDTA